MHHQHVFHGFSSRFQHPITACHAEALARRRSLPRRSNPPPTTAVAKAGAFVGKSKHQAGSRHLPRSPRNNSSEAAPQTIQAIRNAIRLGRAAHRPCPWNRAPRRPGVHRAAPARAHPALPHGHLAPARARLARQHQRGRHRHLHHVLSDRRRPDEYLGAVRLALYRRRAGVRVRARRDWPGADPMGTRDLARCTTRRTAGWSSPSRSSSPRECSMDSGAAGSRGARPRTEVRGSSRRERPVRSRQERSCLATISSTGRACGES